MGQNNIQIISSAAKNFNILASSLNFQQNYFNEATKLFSDLYSANF